MQSTVKPQFYYFTSTDATDSFYAQSKSKIVKQGFNTFCETFTQEYGESKPNVFFLSYSRMSNRNTIISGSEKQFAILGDYYFSDPVTFSDAILLSLKTTVSALIRKKSIQDVIPHTHPQALGAVKIEDSYYIMSCIILDGNHFAPDAPIYRHNVRERHVNTIYPSSAINQIFLKDFAYLKEIT